jgi:large subunit ribosomal protein L4
MAKSGTQNISEPSGDFKLPDLFKNLKSNTHLLHLTVLRQLTNQRAGTASTKTRSEVRGGGKKPWKQKGTGRARVGSIRSPLWVGGGITFGPKPRSFKIQLPKKARNLAIAQAIAAKSGDLILVKSLPTLNNPKTKELQAALKAYSQIKDPLLIIAESTEQSYLNIKKASMNMRNVNFADQKHVGTHDILKSGSIIVTKAAMDKLVERLSKSLKNKNVKVA